MPIRSGWVEGRPLAETKGCPRYQEALPIDPLPAQDIELLPRVVLGVRASCLGADYAIHQVVFSVRGEPEANEPPNRTTLDAWCQMTPRSHSRAAAGKSVIGFTPWS
jgi:hypothetical protein